MELQHINVKIFAENPEIVDLQVFVAIFNNWIQRQITPELLIDVADYRHVHAGPGVVLVGHEANYSMDNAENRLGLRYNRKARVEGTNHARLFQAAHAALAASRRLEEENRFKFNANEIQIIFNDRLLAPNTSAALRATEDELKVFFDTLFAGAQFSIAQPSPDLRERLSVYINTSAQFNLEMLLKNLERQVVEVKS